MVLHHTEVRLGDGTVVWLEVDEKKAPTDEALAEIKKSLALAHNIHVPDTKAMNISHGGLGSYTRFKFKQYDYAGGNEDMCGGYVEVLDIADAPDGRPGFIYHEYRYPGLGHSWSEWKTLEDARAARKKYPRNEEEAKKLPGFIRFIGPTDLIPWFNAFGDMIIVGDFALFSGFEDDPMFRLGTKWVVNEGGLPEIKVCMGTRFIEERREDLYSGSEKKVRYRIVYWSDGSVWNEYAHENDRPRPLEDSEAWIEEAMKQFRLMLTGKSDAVSIAFADGTRFSGSWKPAKTERDPAGDYWVELTIDGGENREGKVEFTPTDRNPTVVAKIRNDLKLKDGERIVRIKVTSKELREGGKKWNGVFHVRKPPTAPKA